MFLGRMVMALLRRSVDVIRRTCMEGLFCSMGWWVIYGRVCQMLALVFGVIGPGPWWLEVFGRSGCCFLFSFSALLR